MAVYWDDSRINSDDPEERASSKIKLDNKKCYYQVTEEKNPQDSFCCSDNSTSADLPGKFSKLSISIVFENQLRSIFYLMYI